MRYGCQALLTHWKVVGGLPRYVGEVELEDAGMAGWNAAATKTAMPAKFARHRLLARALREGYEAERANLREEQQEQDWRDQKATYAAIDRDEMDAVLE